VHILIPPPASAGTFWRRPGAVLAPCRSRSGRTPQVKGLGRTCPRVWESGGEAIHTGEQKQGAQKAPWAACEQSTDGPQHLLCPHTLILTSGPPSCSAREGCRMKLLAMPAFVRALGTRLTCVASYVCICTYLHGVCPGISYWIRTHSLCMLPYPTGNTSPASLLAGPWGMELQQPRLSQAVASRLIRFPPTLSVQNNLGRKGGGTSSI